jgi:multidrug efflux pump subunit AcrA (membrane-fusion protein)
MANRKSILLGIAVIFSCIVLTVLLAGMKKAPKEKKEIKKEIVVPVQKIKNENMELFLPVVGRLEAHDKLDVYSEVSGILQASSKSFLEGVKYQKGEVLLSIDNSKFQSEIYSLRSEFMNKIAGILPDLKYDYPDSYSSWLTYLDAFEIEHYILPIPEPNNTTEKYYLAGKKIYSDYYQIKSQEEQLRKYVIKAPFEGEVIEASIKPGTLVMTGQKLGEYVNTNCFDLVAGIDLNNLEGIKVGNAVKLYSASTGKEWKGIVSRISNKIDEKTQMVNVFVKVHGADLKDGMFLNADISLSNAITGVEIPRKLLIDSDNVYVVENGMVRIQKVSVVQRKEDSVVVQGLQNGCLLALKTNSLHKGLSVVSKLSETSN